MGPFQITKVIAQQAYRLSLPEDWKIYSAFHVSLLKNWKTTNLQEDLQVTTNDVHDVEEPYYEIKRILHWRKVKRNKKLLKGYLVLWRGYLVEEASWIQANKFSHPRQLQDYLEEDKPQEEKV